MATTNGDSVAMRHDARGGTLTRRGFLRAAGLALGGLAVAGATPLGMQTARAAAMHTFLRNYPDNRTTAWTEDIQGVAHDSANWFISQTKALWKFPVGFDLNLGVSYHGASDTDIKRGIRWAGMPPALADLGYNHFGDIDHYGGYLFVPVQGSRTPAIAVFRASDLAYCGYQPVSAELGDLPWCAINPVTGVLHCSVSDTKDGLVYRYPVELANVPRGWGFLGAKTTRTLRDEIGAVVDVQHAQGGAFHPDGQRFYLQAAGIQVFDAAYRRIARSTNGSGAFNYEYYEISGQEPEGLTYWDLTNDSRAPAGVRGVLHALLLDNDGWDSADDVYFKHYR